MIRFEDEEEEFDLSEIGDDDYAPCVNYDDSILEVEINISCFSCILLDQC